MKNNKKQWVHALYLLVFVGVIAAIGSFFTSAPGKSVPAEVPNSEETAFAKRLRTHVGILTENGERRAKARSSLDNANEYIYNQLRRMGYQVVQREFTVSGMPYTNLEVEIPGASLANEVVVLGAHYDSHRKSPGADDNASGCAILLEIAREMNGQTSARTLRLVFFALSEWPHQRTDEMGSRHWVRGAVQRGDDIVAMLSLDSLGVYLDRPGSQSYPLPLNFYYPDTGNFVGFLGNMSSRGLLKKSVRLFRNARRMPAEGLTVPGWMPSVSASDHWSFWQEGIPAVLVTDTMGWRNDLHHGELDLVGELDYERMALVVSGLVEVCRGLTRPGSM
jgi:Zn-dependent M28 family amino/carboxypeptidase